MAATLYLEDMEQEAANDYFEELAEKSDGLSRFMAASAQGVYAEEQDDALDDETAELIERRFLEVRNRKLFNGEPLITEEFDEAINRLLEIMPDKFRDWYYRDRSYYSELSDSIYSESGPTGLRESHWRHMIDHCVQTVMVSLQCEDSPYTTADMFRTLPASWCDDNTHIQFCEKIPKMAPEFCCATIDEPVTFVNEVMTRKCWTTPRPCLRNIAYGLHEDTNCNNNRAVMQSDLETMIRGWRDELAEKERISALFGLPACSSCHSSAVLNDWNYDGQTCPGYLYPGEGLWANSFIGPEFNPNYKVSNGNCPEPADQYRKRLKHAWKHTTNWHTGHPVQCGLGQYQIMLGGSEDLADHFRGMFGSFVFEHGVTGICDGKVTTNIGEDPEFSTTYRYSALARQCLVDFFLNNTINGTSLAGDPITINPAPNLLTAEYRADNTFLVSRNWQETFAMWRIDEFTRDLTGRNHWHYFDRGYDEAHRQFWGYVFGFWRPWLTSRFFAFDPSFEPGT